jgi:hypothetical protein
LPKPCGTFVKYDPINSRTEPELKGVLGGIDYKDGSYQYVGYGNNDFGPACAGQVSELLFLNKLFLPNLINLTKS